MSANDPKGLHRAYNNAGPAFLAVKMERIFTKIETDEERVLHNDILKDVLVMLGDKQGTFFRNMANAIINQKNTGRKRFLFRLAEQVIHLGIRKD